MSHECAYTRDAGSVPVWWQAFVAMLRAASDASPAEAGQSMLLVYHNSRVVDVLAMMNDTEANKELTEFIHTYDDPVYPDCIQCLTADLTNLFESMGGTRIPIPPVRCAFCASDMHYLVMVVPAGNAGTTYSMMDVLMAKPKWWQCERVGNAARLVSKSR